ncbi:MAG TPA: AI-2E family transporter, partial [Armatimonadota bacterium]
MQSKSWIPIIALLAMLLLLFLLWKVVLVFMLAAFFAFLLYPLVAFLDRKLPHVLSIICVYLIIALLLGIVIGLLVPVMADQAGQLADNIPGYVQKARNFSSSLHTRYISLPPVWRSIIDRTLIELQQGSVRLAQESIGVVFAVFGSLLTLVLVPLFAFFMLLDNKGYRRMIDALTPKRHRKKVDDLLYCTGRTLWSFFKGEFLLMSVVGIADGVGLALVGTPYPVVLGVIGGLLEVVPSIGPTVTNIIVILIALTISPVAALK